MWSGKRVQWTFRDVVRSLDTFMDPIVAMGMHIIILVVFPCPMNTNTMVIHVVTITDMILCTTTIPTLIITSIKDTITMVLRATTTTNGTNTIQQRKRMHAIKVAMTISILTTMVLHTLATQASIPTPSHSHNSSTAPTSHRYTKPSSTRYENVWKPHTPSPYLPLIPYGLHYYKLHVLQHGSKW
jgi:hypothetical protein